MTHHDNAAEHDDVQHETDAETIDRIAPGSAAETIAEAENNAGTQRPAPDIEESDRAASEESRRIAAAEDTEL